MERQTQETKHYKINRQRMVVKQSKSQGQSDFWKGIFNGVLISTAILGIAMGTGLNLNIPETVNQAQAQQNLSDFESMMTETASKASKAVVSVENYQYGQGMYGNLSELFENHPNQDQGLEGLTDEPQLAGTGSGVVYKVEGDYAYIVTNNHVVEGSDKLEIQTPEGEKTEADLLGTDVYSDLAVLRISSDHAKEAIELADSDQIQVGSIAMAIGSPLDISFASSVTQGIVSGLNRAVPVDYNGDQQLDWEMNLIQTDAAINPGNSGGALVNSKGQLIGINSSKLASAQIEGMGFAIPSNDVKQITQQLETEGEVVRPALGVSTYDIAQLSEEIRVEDLQLDPDMLDGVLIARIMPRSSAEDSGLERFDVITKINDEPITDNQSLRQIIYRHKIGDTVKMTVIRQGKEEVVDVTLNDNINANDYLKR